MRIEGDKLIISNILQGDKILFSISVCVCFVCLSFSNEIAAIVGYLMPNQSL